MSGIGGSDQYRAARRVRGRPKALDTRPVRARARTTEPTRTVTPRLVPDARRSHRRRRQGRSDAGLSLRLRRRSARLRRRRERGLVLVHRASSARARATAARSRRSACGRATASRSSCPTNEDFVLCFFGAHPRGHRPRPDLPAARPRPAPGLPRQHAPHRRQERRARARHDARRSSASSAPCRRRRPRSSRSSRSRRSASRSSRCKPREASTRRHRVPPVHERLHVAPQGRDAHAREPGGERPSASCSDGLQRDRRRTSASRGCRSTTTWGSSASCSRRSSTANPIVFLPPLLFLKRPVTLAPGDHAPQGHDLVRPELRVRALREAHPRARARGHRSLELARRRLRRRADPPGDARGLRRARSRKRRLQEGGAPPLVRHGRVVARDLASPSSARA